MAVKKEHFGRMADGREISLYTIDNGTVSASFTDLGAVWVSMMVPDRNGDLADVLLGYDDAEGYLVNGPHFGSIVGRIANRTGGASFLQISEQYLHRGWNLQPSGSAAGLGMEPSMGVKRTSSSSSLGMDSKRPRV